MKLGTVKGVFSAKKGFSGLPRPRVDELNLLCGYGIEDDKFANKDLDKTVMIVGTKAYNIAKENSIELEEGSLGENILFDFDPHELSIGDSIKVDDTVLEITEKCSLCNHLSIFNSKLPNLVKNHRGLYCKIIQGGQVDKGAKAFLA